MRSGSSNSNWNMVRACKPGEIQLLSTTRLFLFATFGEGVVSKQPESPANVVQGQKQVTSLTWMVEVLPVRARTAISVGDWCSESGNGALGEVRFHSQSRMRGVNDLDHRENVVGAVVRFDARDNDRGARVRCLHGSMKAKAHRSRLADVQRNLAGATKSNDADQVAWIAAAGWKREIKVHQPKCYRGRMGSFVLWCGPWAYLDRGGSARQNTPSTARQAASQWKRFNRSTRQNLATDFLPG